MWKLIRINQGNDWKFKRSMWTVRERSRRNSHLLLVGLQNSAPRLKGSLAVSYKTKHTLTWDLIIMLLGIYPNVKNLCPYKILHVGIYSSFTHNCQNLEFLEFQNFGIWKQQWYPSGGEWINYGTSRLSKKSWKDMEEP